MTEREELIEKIKLAARNYRTQVENLEQAFEGLQKVAGLVGYKVDKETGQVSPLVVGTAEPDFPAGGVVLLGKASPLLEEIKKYGWEKRDFPGRG
jgi:hypothetical protein